MSTDKGSVKLGESVEEKICQILKKTNAIEFGAFKLSSGRITPYYVDLRVIPSFPDAFHVVSDIFVNSISHTLGTESFDRVSGIPVAGTTRRLRGRERRVEGVLMPGDHVLLVDDLVTTGVSLKRAASAIRAEGGLVSDAFVLLDREEGGKERLAGGKERLAQEGISLHSVLRISKAAKRLYEMNAIDEEQLAIILKQVRTK